MFEYSRFFLNMRSFYLINFSNLFPTKNTLLSTGGRLNLKNDFRQVISISQQEQNLLNTDINFNLTILTPELNPFYFNNKGAKSTYLNTSLNVTQTQVFTSFLNKLTLESVDNINTTFSSNNSL